MYITRLLRCTFAILLFFSLPAPISATPAQLSLGPEGLEAAEVIFRGAEQFRETAGAMTIETIADAPFAPVGRKTADFGYTTDTLWLRVRLVNDGSGFSDWRLHFRSNFLTEIAVWQVDDSGAATLRERHFPDTRFPERIISYPEIVAPLVIPPGTATTVYVRYASGGSSKLSFSVIPAELFAATAATRDARNFAYYGMMAFLVVAAFLACALTRRAIFASYALYAGSALLYIMHSDGNSFRFLWPDAPQFNAYASVLLGSGIIIFGAVFARLFLRTPTYHPVINLLLTGIILITLTLIAITAFGGTQMIKRLLVLLSFLSILLYATAGLIAARHRFREVRFYVVAWAGALAASGIMTARHWFGLDISEELQFDLMRLVLVVDAAMMGLAVLDSVAQIRRTQQEALEQSLQEAQRNLDLTRRLSDLERNYALVTTLAKANQRRLADTAHDLRQPLNALRLNLRRLTEAPARPREMRPLVQEFEESIRYLENLVTSELSLQGADAERALQQQSAGPAHYGVDDVLVPVVQMLAPNALAKGLRLRHVRSSAQTTLPQIALMRIASNLLDNAIKYTPEGSVLIGLRHVDGGLRLEVHDTGPGIAPDAFDKARTRAVRLAGPEEAEGSGLGLAIVDELVGRHGLSLSLCPKRQRGTGLRITLPTG